MLVAQLIITISLCMSEVSAGRRCFFQTVTDMETIPKTGSVVISIFLCATTCCISDSKCEGFSYVKATRYCVNLSYIEIDSVEDATRKVYCKVRL